MTKNVADLRSEYRRRFKRRYLDEDAPAGPRVRKAILEAMRTGVPLAQGLSVQAVARARRALPAFDVALRAAAAKDPTGANRRYAATCLYPAVTGASGYRRGCRCPRCTAGHAGRSAGLGAVPVQAFGQRMTLSERARDPRATVSAPAMRDRLARGWDPERAITTPAVPRVATVDHQQVLDLRRDGMALAQIAERVGASYARVQSLCRMAGLAEPAAARSRTEPLTPQVQARLHDLAARVAVLRGRPRPGSPLDVAAREFDALLAELSDQGYAADRLAAELGYSTPHQVAYRIRRHRRRAAGGG